MLWTLRASLLGLALSLISGCTSLSSLFENRSQSAQELATSKVDTPFFYVPATNRPAFVERSWILLAQSSSVNWFYDPYTLNEDEDGIVSFDAFYAPRLEKNSLNRFNATIVGPYLQKIDCFSNYQWSETLHTKKLPVRGAVPANQYGWIQIKAKTAMAFMKARVCGRKFLDDTNVNYFLYQDGELPPLPANKPKPTVLGQSKDMGQVLPASESLPNLTPAPVAPDSKASILAPLPTFFEVLNNEVLIIDAQKDLREMKIASYTLDKEFSKKADLVYTADCQNKTGTLSMPGAVPIFKGALGDQESLSSIAFNRACADHGSYMKFVSKSRK